MYVKFKRCMLCTLRTSEANINQPITILLTKEAVQDINIYEMKGVKLLWLTEQKLTLPQIGTATKMQ